MRSTILLLALTASFAPAAAANCPVKPKITPYGTACDPGGQPAPTLDVTFDATACALRLGLAIPPAPAGEYVVSQFLLLGATPQANALPSGCTLWNDASFLLPVGPLANGGGVTLPVSCPLNGCTSFVGAGVYVQGAVQTWRPGSKTLSFAVSNGVGIAILLNL